MDLASIGIIAIILYILAGMGALKSFSRAGDLENNEEFIIFLIIIISWPIVLIVMSVVADWKKS